jgi:CRP/FNR family transcriptional regulator, cyclic AMP receptor protein
MRKGLIFLNVLTDTDLDWLIANGSKQQVAPGQRIVEPDRPMKSLFIVVEGRLSVIHEGLEIARLMCGDIVGEISFLDRRLPSASVRAIEQSVVLAISRPELEKKLCDDVNFAARFYEALARFLSDRLRATDNLLGYGTRYVDEYRDEVDPDTLENLSQAGARFDWLQRRLKAT